MMTLVSFTSRLNDLHVRVNPDQVLFFHEMEDKSVKSVRIVFPSNRELEVLGSMGEIEEALSMDFDD